jgi:hypothetical protein
VNGERTGQASEPTTPPRLRDSLLSAAMSQQHNREILPYEDRVILAIQAIKEDVSLSERRAAAIYNVRQAPSMTDAPERHHDAILKRTRQGLRSTKKTRLFNTQES